uniref:NADH-ubiquinone oxidoreductase chain 2 n=1 Tax=Coryphopterus personatus TaxID=151718 RepID=Q94W95_CORPE|nr:NADH dehydrogenase subunit 2 [Coryphopterus personatus]
MSPYVTTVLLTSLGLGTTITFASSHWLLAWMGMEINTLAILPLMTQRHHPRNVEAATKYFLVQAAAASTLLMAALTNAWLTGQWDINLISHPAAVVMATLALSLKLGLAPLHTWLPEVLQGLDLPTGLILSTWQKLAPFILLIQNPSHNQDLLLTLGAFSTVIGGLGGLNQTQLIPQDLAYSSIAHLGWMIVVISYNPPLAALSLSLYLIMTTTVFLSLMINNTTTLNTLPLAATSTPALRIILPLTFLSLAGIPPLTGFLLKWFILSELVKQDLHFFAFFIGMSSLISLFYYLRLAYIVALPSPGTTTGTLPWRLPRPKQSLLLPLCFVLSTALLPIAPALQALTLL